MIDAWKFFKLLENRLFSQKKQRKDKQEIIMTINVVREDSFLDGKQCLLSINSYKKKLIQLENKKIYIYIELTLYIILSILP